jgi:SAM-dependent methyltransferase
MSKIPLEQERISHEEWLPPWTLLEHEARYNFGSNYVTGKHVVDCACGCGIGSKIFLAAEPASFKGFDSEPQAIEDARNTLGSSVQQFKVADAIDLPLSDVCTDVFISLETIEHIHDDASFAKEVARILKPGGLFICSTPNRLVTNPGTDIGDRPWNQFHVREYTPDELRALLEPHFIVTQAFGQNPNSDKKVQIMTRVAAIFGPRIAVRINQLWKCRWFLLKRPSRHSVVPAENGLHYEYTVLLCHKRTH